MQRRNLVGGGVLASLAAIIAGDPAAAAAAQRGDDQELTKAVVDLHGTVARGLAVSSELARIREQQRVFLRSNQKYPDFMEVGLDVWDSVYDWHVRHQLPADVRRLADGRYVMTVMFTTLILRQDQAVSYVGFGFDTR